MVNKPLIRPYFWGGSFGGVARIPMKIGEDSVLQVSSDHFTPGWLFDIGDEMLITQLYRDYNKPI